MNLYYIFFLISFPFFNPLLQPMLWSADYMTLFCILGIQGEQDK